MQGIIKYNPRNKATGYKGSSFFKTVFKTVASFIILTMVPALSWAQPMEYLLKAGFLEKFARFTDWPDTGDMKNPDSPFVISIIGASPFKGSLEEIYKKAVIKNKPVIIRYINSKNQIPGTHLLFICESEKNKLEDILQTAQNYPVLIVSDTEGFAEKGTHINLYTTKKNTLHFEINVGAVKKSGLSIQLVLLEIAKVLGN